ncbi:MAG: hypothetical protein RIQ38_1499 [Pseudomonadota bacterium]|jgi:2-iminobutanoate/2-iminopropanoate deaminase
MRANARSIEVPGIGHNAPIPLAARVGPLLCSSAIAGKDPANGQLPASAHDQVRQAFANLDAVLAAAGGGLEHLVKLAITLADNGLRDAVNQEWLARFPDAHDRPARHITVQPLGHGMQIQLECMAFIQP